MGERPRLCRISKDSLYKEKKEETDKLYFININPSFSWETLLESEMPIHREEKIFATHIADKEQDPEYIKNLYNSIMKKKSLILE